MIRGLGVPLIFPSCKTLYPASPSLQWVALGTLVSLILRHTTSCAVLPGDIQVLYSYICVYKKQVLSLYLR